MSADMSTQEGVESAVSAVRDSLAPPSIVTTQADILVRGLFGEITRAEDYKPLTG
ncbi:hypothetical protein O983_27785 [Mycobacterium avium 09-5983]|nr:hypothetical protein O983_27785 [Mycobacterium avium 09-5983]